MRPRWSSIAPAFAVLTVLSGSANAEAAADHTYTVAGLEQPAEIIVDHWGVPHIYAGTHYDAFFVQGFNAARDRLWQIDLWRRRGLGQLAEVLGERYVEQDAAARLFLYRGPMYSEWLAYASDAKRIAQAFTNGINAYVALVDADPELLPPEFELLGYRPAIWALEDVVRIRSHGLRHNVRNEAKRAHIVCQAGLEAAALWKRLEPTWTTQIPDGLDPCVVPQDVLATYELATAAVDFSANADLAGSGDPAPWPDVLTDSLGSNNWVVAPQRTDTGRPILANDPHRTHSAPSLRYISHLSAPGLNVIGAGEPALPGISIGHNERIAFGLTIFWLDQEDLYVYEKTAGGYRYGIRSEPLVEVHEEIAVRGGTPRSKTLRFTRHGPVVRETEDYLFAVRAAWLEPGMAPYFGSVEYMRAQNWREFVAALNRWGAPPENQIYADIDGNIGYKPAGRFPRRKTWDGLFPVPGDGRYEWEGYFDMDALPNELNPARGFTGSANAMNLPPDFPIHQRRVGFEWSAPWRYQRLWQVLTQQQTHTLTDSHELQRDYTSLLAKEVVDHLPDTLRPDTPLALLKRWDGSLDANSPAAALYVIWYYRHLGKTLAERMVPAVAEDILPLDSRAVLDALADPASREAALSSLEAAWQAAKTLLGPSPNEWRWGDLHQIRFEHPLQHLADPKLRRAMTYPAYRRGGSSNTTNNTEFNADDFLVRSGASFRMVLDVGQWDDAEMTNAPGQSGRPGSPFYQNLLEGWAQDSSFPLLFSREAVAANQALKIQLLPADVTR